MSDPAEDAVRLAARLGLAVPAADHAEFHGALARLLDQAGLVLALALTLPDEGTRPAASFEP